MDLGEVAVQDDDVIAIHQRLLDAGCSVVCDVGADAPIAQPVGNVVGQLDVVLNDQHSHSAILHQTGSQRCHSGTRRPARPGHQGFAATLPGRVRPCCSRVTGRRRTSSEPARRPPLSRRSQGGNMSEQNPTRGRKEPASGGARCSRCCAWDGDRTRRVPPDRDSVVASLAGPSGAAQARSGGAPDQRRPRATRTWSASPDVCGLTASRSRTRSHRSGHPGLTIQLPPPDATTRPGYHAAIISSARSTRGEAAHGVQETAPHLPALASYARVHAQPRHPTCSIPTPQGSLNLGNVPGITDDFGRYSPQFRTPTPPAGTAARRRPR